MKHPAALIREIGRNSRRQTNTQQFCNIPDCASWLAPSIRFVRSSKRQRTVADQNNGVLSRVPVDALLVLLLGISCCVVKCAAGSLDSAIIPQPGKIEKREGAFHIRGDTRIVCDGAPRVLGDYLSEHLRRSTTYNLKVIGSARELTNAILLTTRDAQAALGSEGYTLSVTPGDIAIRATQSAGLFYGVQSLLQLLPPEALATNRVQDVDWTLPGLQIEDRPRFVWRGFLLDVGRHFFSPTEIKEVFDLMALYKLNTFHWHLTDDQGWRIEIKKYPRLVQAGAWRKNIGFGLDPKESNAYGPDGRYGGFYSQAQVRELVGYARARNITIVPEIEMPGHASAALAAYPQFSCFGGPYNTDIGGGIYAGVYCAGKDETFEFVQNVLAEVCALFPGKYIHIGGDEVPPDNWHKCPRCQARMQREGLKSEHELESYFVRRVEKFLNARHRNLIGWSEIREGGLAQNAAIMDWIGGAVEAATAGHDVVMTPTDYCYLDYYQATNHPEPKAIGGYLPLERVYAFEPIPAGLPPQFHSHILGAQGNLWTEYIGSLRHAEYMMFPRLCALAEVAWSPAGTRNYDDFFRRLQVHGRRFDEMGVNYRRQSLTAPVSRP
ncbi:MAG TPA: beta-N-acetylhexosaminidase [Candidatus Limnocylindrales bacterium]|nr:beta-N-acetylhexosaminidase [Candidatus Limnocylindrales bacterium]